MDSAKVKELISKDRDAHSDGYARMLLRGVLKQIEDFEAAEREQWKSLPPCNEERGKVIAAAIDPCTWYNVWFCTYHRYLLDAVDVDIHRCACAIEPTADQDRPAEEPEGDIVGDGHISEYRFHVLRDQAIYNSKRLDKIEDGSHHKEIHRRLGDLEVHKGQPEPDHFKEIYLRIAKLKKVDTAFSAKLGEYLERLEKTESVLDFDKHDNFFVWASFNVVHGRIDELEQQLKKQEDDQLEEGARE